MLPLTFNRGSSEHRTYRLAGFGLLILLMVLCALFLPEFQLFRMNRAMATAVAILGLNLVVGYSGLFALCQSAFIALGAFTCGTLIQDEGWDYWMTIPAGMFVAFLVGLLLGIPALKIKGLYLAMATVAFATAFPSFSKLEFFGIPERTGGANGKEIDEKLLPPGWLPGFDELKPNQYQFALLALLALGAFWAVGNLVKSRPGRAIISIRDNEIGSAVSGVNLRQFKVLNFGLSAAIGGLAGVMWGMNSGFVAEQDFTFVLMVDLLVGLVVGGVATVSGAAIGAVVVVFGRWLCQTYFNYSLAAIALWIAMAAGISAGIKMLTGKQQQMVARVGAAIGAVLLLISIFGVNIGPLSGLGDIGGWWKAVLVVVIVALAAAAERMSTTESGAFLPAAANIGAWLTLAPISVLLWNVLVRKPEVLTDAQAAALEDGAEPMQGLIPGLYQLNGDGPLSQAIFGFVLIGFVFFAPQGIVGTWRKLWANVVRIQPVPPALPDDAEILVKDMDALHDSIQG